MATALCTTEEKENFQRLARLLMRGGVTLLREVFDTIHPPANLSVKLNDPATKMQLKGAKLSKPEWDCVYPSAGICGKSTDFDITLLFRLLRTICFLSSPTTGWDKLPNPTDHSREADLARIKYYRNSVCGHNHTREITDTDFANLWREISKALLRIAGTISTLKRDEWEKAIDNLLHDPLTPDAERYVAELLSWYKKDMDAKEEIEKLGNKMEQMNVENQDEFKKLGNKMEQMNAENQEEFEKLGNKMEQMDIRIHIIMESFKAGGTHAIPQPQEANLQPSTSESANQELQQNFQTSVDIWQVILSFKSSFSLLFEYLKIKLGVDVQDCRSGSLVITVSCSSLESLVGLWNDYRSGHLNKVVQETLVTEEVLKELCLSEVKLKTIISDMEYKASKKFLNQKTGQWKKKKKKKEKKEIPIPVVPTVIKPAALGQWKKKKKKKEKKEIPIPVVPTVVKPAALVVPGRPRITKPEDQVETSFTLTWERPAYDGGDPNIKYKVEWRKKPVESNPFPEEVDNIGETNLLLTDLEGGEDYEFKVFAKNKEGYGDPATRSYSVQRNDGNENLQQLCVEETSTIETPSITASADMDEKISLKIREAASLGAVMAPTSLDNRPVSDKELHDIGSSLPSSWKRLGRCLRIPEKGLETIDMREHDTGRKGILMLNMWKETWGKYATGSVLKVALEEIGRPDLSIKAFPTGERKISYPSAVPAAEPASHGERKIPSLLLPTMAARPASHAKMDPTGLENRPVSLKILVNLAKDPGIPWKKLGRHLGIPEDVLTSIDLEDQFVEQKNRAMLNMWRRKRGDEATVKVLREALENIGRSDLAEKVEERTYVKYREIPKGENYIAESSFVMMINDYSFLHTTRFDDVRLKSVFQLKWGFKLGEHENLTKSEMLKELRHTADRDFSTYDCFVCMIRSEHGIFDSAGKVINPETITSLFTRDKCPSLDGKPKIFLIETLEQFPVSSLHLAVSEDDFLIWYAPLHFDVFFSIETPLSFIVKSLEFYSEADSPIEPLQDILIKENKRLKYHSPLQQPYLFSSLTKKVFLKSK